MATTARVDTRFRASRVGIRSDSTGRQWAMGAFLCASIAMTGTKGWIIRRFIIKTRQYRTGRARPAVYKQTSSERRVTAAGDTLLAHGVRTDNIAVAGHGESQLMAGNRTRSGRAANRGTEFEGPEPRELTDERLEFQ